MIKLKLCITFLVYIFCLQARAVSANRCEGLFVQNNALNLPVTKAETAKLANLSHSQIFDHPDFYSVLQDKPALIKKLMVSWYGRNFTSRWLSLFNFAGHDYSVLLLDPGIADRVGEFLNFSHSYLAENPAQGPLELRNAFKKYLGKVIVYRTMVLTPEQAAEILRQGIKSPGLHSNTETALKWFQSGSSPIKDIVSRVTEDNETASLAISTSEMPEVALSAVSYRIKSDEPDKFVYLFEIVADEINVVRENQRLATIPYFAKLAKTLQSTQLIFKSPNDEYFNSSWMNGSTEVFILNHIPASTIKTMSQLNDQRPWEIIDFGSARGTTNIDKDDVQPRKFQVIENPHTLLRYNTSWQELRNTYEP